MSTEMLELTIALFLVTIGLWIIWRRRLFMVLKDMGISGPKPSFLFGNLWEMSSKTPVECLEEWLKKYGTITGFYFGTMPMVVISEPDMLKKIQVSEFHKFINRPKMFQNRHSKPGDGVTASLTNVRDKRWKELRSTMTPSFTTRKMRTMAPIINNAIDILIQRIEVKAKKREWFDVYEMYQGLTMDVIGRTAFGIQTDCQRNPNDPFLRTIRLIFSGDMKSYIQVLQFCFPEFEAILHPIGLIHLSLMNKGINPIKELLQSVRRVIRKRRENAANRRQDLLQLMIDAQISESDANKVTADELTAGHDNPCEAEEAETAGSAAQTNSKRVQPMNDDEILDNAVMFFMAGYETTSTALAFTTHFLLHYPEVQERVRDEVKDLVEREGKLDYSSVQRLQYLDQVLTESLRLYPPIYLFVSREVDEDVTIGELHLKKGVAVQVPVYNIQRDERFWPEPNKFDPDRFSPENKSRNHPFAFQAFGAGPRNCVGMRFAQMEAKLALARILLKYRLEKCEKTDKLDLTLRVSAVTMSPRNGINLIAIPLKD